MIVGVLEVDETSPSPHKHVSRSAARVISRKS